MQEQQRRGGNRGRKPCPAGRDCRFQRASLVIRVWLVAVVALLFCH
jgi:hypothetical protein